ncbi:helix-turn-helix domain-containing protein [Floridanema evergladense]|uniref:Helix-turn-helix domain-containing protein n=1 Tax=Floridaenema evergladense BLCC-F167 TaxID=3153639 RepID=A0ABV4WD59_9CYAN
MKTLIELDVPIETALTFAKGDRTLRDIEQASGVDRSNVSYILNGRSTTLETLRKLGQALGVDVDSAVREALREVGL